MNGKVILTLLLSLFSAGLGYGLSQAAAGEGGAQLIPAGAAQVGTRITYQGSLSDEDAPASGSYDFYFRLFDTASGGNQVGSLITLDDVTVEEGLFTVQLDFGASAFGGGSRWLEIGVRPGDSNVPYTILSPRQELTPAPYALSLPGVYVKEELPFVGVGRDYRLSSAEVFGIRREGTGYGGMYVETSDAAGKPFYGYATDGDYKAWHYYDGVTGEWILYNNSPRLSVPEDGGLVVGSTTNNGLEVDSAGNFGVLVDSAGAAGVLVHSPGANGLHVNYPSHHGLYVNSAGDSGVYVGSAGNYAGYFNGNVQITGTCTGCALAVFGTNSSDHSLQPGTIVSLNAAYTPPEPLTGAPILMAVGPANASQPPVGIVVGRAELDAGEEEGDEQPHLVPREGAAAPGEYVTILIYGLAQVHASALDAPIAAGDRLTVDAAGNGRQLQTRELDGMIISEGAPTVGTTLEGLPSGQQGLIWVLVGR